MAFNSITIPAKLGTQIWSFAISNTPRTNITGTAGVKVYSVQIDCTSNTAEDVYLCFYDQSGAPSFGDDPDMCLWGKKAVATEYLFPRGSWSFATAMTIVCVQEASGGTAFTAPSGTVTVTMQLDE